MQGAERSVVDWQVTFTSVMPKGDSIELMSGALRPWLKTWYMGISRTSCSTEGRQPEAGFTPRSL